MERSFIREILDVIDKDCISFAGGLPDNALFPIEYFQEAAKKLYETPEVFQYASTYGLKKLREFIAKEYQQQGFATSSENILITTGSQQGLYILSNYFKNKNIVVESPSYLGAMKCFHTHSLNAKSIKLFDKSAFEKEFESAKIAYLIPDFQNPSGFCYEENLREFVAKIVKQNNGILIEDAPYTQLYFNKGFKSISSQLPENSFHLGSFSKTLAPGLRLGWIRADKKLLEGLLPAKESIDLHSCMISQQMAYNFLSKEGNYQEHLKRIRTVYKEKMEFFCDTLKQYLPQFRYNKPKGGMFIYGKLKGYDTKELVYKAIKHGVAFVPGTEFYKDSSGKNEIRFNFTAPSKAEIEKGVKILSELV